MQKRKNRKSTYRRRSAPVKQKATPLAWLLGGIIIGLLIPGIYLLKQSISKQDPHHTYSEIKVAEHKETQPNKAQTPKVTSSHKKKDKDTLNPNYEFYNLLSSQEENPTTFKENEIESSQENKFLLEIASFKTFAEADNLKAELLLLGIENVTISKSPGSKQSAYKVTAGPFNSKVKASKVQKQLKENSITSVLTAK